MDDLTIGIVASVGMLIMLLIGVRVYAAAAITGLLGCVAILGWDAGAGIVGTVPHSKAVNYALSVLPMFILIGFVAYHAGLTHALFKAARAWFGWVPGGLAVAKRAEAAVDFIEANNRVCFELDRNVKLQTDPENSCKWTFLYESVVGYGAVSELTEPAEKTRGLDQVMLHYSGRQWEFNASVLAKTRVWQILIDSVTGKRAVEKVCEAHVVQCLVIAGIGGVCFGGSLIQVGWGSIVQASSRAGTPGRHSGSKRPGGKGRACPARWWSSLQSARMKGLP